MRTLLKMQVDVDAGNRAITEGSIQQVLPEVLETLKPEAAYFGAEEGKRTAWLFFDLDSPSDIPPIVEPLFQTFNASVTLSPVMNQEELQGGLAQAG